MPPNSQLLAENGKIIYAEPEKAGDADKKLDRGGPDWSLLA